MRRLAAALALGSTIFFAEARADAYCRTTTCDPRIAKCSRDENGCVRSGVPVTWTKLPIVYRFAAQGSSKLEASGARSAIRAAFGRWANVQCAHGRTSLRFQEHSTFTREGTTFGIRFRDDTWTHDDAEETLAITNVSYGTVYGDIDAADIEINTAQHDFVLGDEAGVDLEAVMTHEVGHYIGLAHSDDPASIMVPAYCQSGGRCADKETARELSDDDVTAVCALYPPEGIAGVQYAQPESSGCSTSGGRGGAGGCIFVALVIARRRRRA